MNQLSHKLALGAEIDELIPQLGQLRIAVFHDFPYLYEGSLEYEQDYLYGYTQNPLSIAFGIFDGAKLVGATMGIPLNSVAKTTQQPFIDRGLNTDEIFYFGESILLPAYRGQGLGHLFFDVREKHALENGFKVTAFCSVVRPEDHPLHPADYRPNTDFWKKRGYIEQNYCCKMSWLDRNETEETEKELLFWTKEWK
ncbi:GNAT family N-acetyltransferase [Fluviicola taffensis]|uniref:GNAT family N-acetyltransferase n=1 Tax=Fluviicola taffensis TaxID=191579 RepID=UPI00313824AB